jgi:hypothetical protein
MLTANDDPEEDANDEIPDGHRHHDTGNSDILWSAHAVTSVPECLLDKVKSQHEDECADNHDRCCQIVNIIYKRR